MNYIISLNIFYVKQKLDLSFLLQKNLKELVIVAFNTIGKNNFLLKIKFLYLKFYFHFELRNLKFHIVSYCIKIKTPIFWCFLFFRLFSFLLPFSLIVVVVNALFRI